MPRLRTVRLSRRHPPGPGCQAFSSRRASWADELGIHSSGALTVLGDGAAWSWSAATEHFPGAEQVLDIFHASQHIASAAAGLHGEGTDAAKRWLEGGRQRLMAAGWPGLLDHIGGTPSEDRTESGQAALDGLVSYMAKHAERIGYFGRLRTGRSIRQRSSRRAGQANGTSLEGGRPRVVFQASGWDGGVDRQRRHTRMAGPVGPDRRLISRLKSYTHRSAIDWPRTLGNVPEKGTEGST